MKKIFGILSVLTGLLFSCSPTNNDSSSTKESASQNIVNLPIIVPYQDAQKKTFFFEGTIHFTSYADYIVDTYGYAHILFGSKQGDKKEPNFYQSKAEKRPTLSANDFVDGEKVCFTWGETNSFLCSKVNDIYKYDKDILTPVGKKKGKIEKETIGHFLSDDRTMDITSYYSDDLLYLTSDFKGTKVDYSKDYYAYTVTGRRTRVHQEETEVLFFVEA